jgi:hypothetical protein
MVQCHPGCKTEFQLSEKEKNWDIEEVPVLKFQCYTKPLINK